jgi:hypothetical protein
MYVEYEICGSEVEINYSTATAVKWRYSNDRKYVWVKLVFPTYLVSDFPADSNFPS